MVEEIAKGREEQNQCHPRRNCSVTKKEFSKNAKQLSVNSSGTDSICAFLTKTFLIFKVEALAHVLFAL